MTDPDDTQDYQERLAGEQASEMPLDELTDDPGATDTDVPGRGEISGANEPSPTGTVGQSDFPVNGTDTQSG
ncbi:MAG: hypothetical protein K0R01_1570 [Mycobacterium sp.]|jgi:hypothetical protein|nr:hypothetical protein [Mycobacterium sp.]